MRRLDAQRENQFHGFGASRSERSTASPAVGKETAPPLFRSGSTLANSFGFDKQPVYRKDEPIPSDNAPRAFCGIPGDTAADLKLKSGSSIATTAFGFQDLPRYKGESPLRERAKITFDEDEGDCESVFDFIDDEDDRRSYMTAAEERAEFAAYNGPSMFKNLRRRRTILRPVLTPDAPKSRFAVQEGQEKSIGDFEEPQEEVNKEVVVVEEEDWIRENSLASETAASSPSMTPPTKKILYNNAAVAAEEPTRPKDASIAEFDRPPPTGHYKHIAAPVELPSELTKELSLPEHPPAVGFGGLPGFLRSPAQVYQKKHVHSDEPHEAPKKLTPPSNIAEDEKNFVAGLVNPPSAGLDKHCPAPVTPKEPSRPDSIHGVSEKPAPPVAGILGLVNPPSAGLDKHCPAPVSPKEPSRPDDLVKKPMSPFAGFGRIPSNAIKSHQSPAPVGPKELPDDVLKKAKPPIGGFALLSPASKWASNSLRAVGIDPNSSSPKSSIDLQPPPSTRGISPSPFDRVLSPAPAVVEVNNNDSRKLETSGDSEETLSVSVKDAVDVVAEEKKEQKSGPNHFAEELIVLDAALKGLRLPQGTVFSQETMMDLWRIGKVANILKNLPDLMRKICENEDLAPLLKAQQPELFAKAKKLIEDL